MASDPGDYIGIHNEDWLRARTWDLPTDADEFITYLTNRDMSLAHFMSLPAAIPMPGSLYDELIARGIT